MMPKEGVDHGQSITSVMFPSDVNSSWVIVYFLSKEENGLNDFKTKPAPSSR